MEDLPYIRQCLCHLTYNSDPFWNENEIHSKSTAFSSTLIVTLAASIHRWGNCGRQMWVWQDISQWQRSSLGFNVGWPNRPC